MEQYCWHSDDVGSGLADISTQETLWHVHSVFARACNLVNSQGTILTLIQQTVPRTPFAIHLGEPSPPFHTILEPHMQARLNAHELCIDDRIHIHRHNERVWNATLPSHTCSLQNSLYTASILQLHQALEQEKNARQKNIQDRMAQLVQQALDDAEYTMVTALLQTEDTDYTALLHAANKFLGLGPGLTPSGDDMLVGILAGLQWKKSEKLVPLQTWLTHEASLKTNAIAATFIQHACAGHFSEGILDIFTAIENNTGLEAAIKRLLEFGASSGYDTLRGIFLALAYEAPHIKMNTTLEAP